MSSSAASMSAIVRSLIARGVVFESGKNSTNFGRKPVSLSVRNDLGYLVGVDMGSFLIRVVVTDIVGNVLYKAEMETKMAEGRDRVLSRTFKAIHTAINESQTPKGTIKGIGMPHSLVIDSRNGIVLCFPRAEQMTQWRNVPLRDILGKVLAVPSGMHD